MQEERSQSSMLTMFGVIFTVIALVALIALVLVRSKAQTMVQQSGTLGAEANTITSITYKATMNGPSQNFIDLVSNSTAGGFWVMTVEVPNGATTIDLTGTSVSVSALNQPCANPLQRGETACFHISMAGGTVAQVDPINSPSTFTITSAANSTAVPYNQDATTYFVSGVLASTVTNAATYASQSPTFTVNTLRALTVNSNVIAYGNVQNNLESNPQVTSFHNSGNAAADAIVYATSADPDHDGRWILPPYSEVNLPTITHFVGADSNDTTGFTWATATPLDIVEQVPHNTVQPSANFPIADNGPTPVDKFMHSSVKFHGATPGAATNVMYFEAALPAIKIIIIPIGGGG